MEQLSLMAAGQSPQLIELGAAAIAAEAEPTSLNELMNKGSWADKEIDQLCEIFREQRKNWRKDELAGAKRPRASAAKAAPKAKPEQLSLDDLEL
jgi:hypothetical protein